MTLFTAVSTWLSCMGCGEREGNTEVSFHCEKMLLFCVRKQDEKTNMPRDSWKESRFLSASEPRQRCAELLSLPAMATWSGPVSRPKAAAPSQGHTSKARSMLRRMPGANEPAPTSTQAPSGRRTSQHRPEAWRLQCNP